MRRTSEKGPFYRVPIHARECLDQAVALLRRFDEADDVHALFYAALQLRLGIEHRLYDYVDAELRSLGREGELVRDYVATRLLRSLQQLDPDTADASLLTITNEQTGKSAAPMAYTPVTMELARDHGRLGDLLHAKFFRSNPYWYTRKSLAGHGSRSLADCRAYLAEVVERLRYSTSGTLLTHFKVNELVVSLVEEEDHEDDA